MATDEVIANLVRELQPVRPLPVPRVRLARWGLTVVATLAVVTVGLGPRANLLASLATLPFYAHSILLLLVALSSAVAALAMAIPGEQVRPSRRWAPVVAGLAWAAWLATELMVLAFNGGGLSPGTAGIGCVAKAVVFGVAPGMALTLMLGRGLPGDPRTTMVFAALAVAAVGALGVEWTCLMTNPSHLLVWHGGAVVAAVLAAAVAGRPLFKVAALAVSRSRR